MGVPVMRLEGKVAVITGAGQRQGESIGNGRAAAVLFAREVYLGLLGSLTSLLFAVVGGYLWEHGHTLAHPLIGQKP